MREIFVFLVFFLLSNSKRFKMENYVKINVYCRLVLQIFQVLNFQWQLTKLVKFTSDVIFTILERYRDKHLK